MIILLLAIIPFSLSDIEVKKVEYPILFEASTTGGRTYSSIVNFRADDGFNEVVYARVDVTLDNVMPNTQLYATINNQPCFPESITIRNVVDRYNTRFDCTRQVLSPDTMTLEILSSNPSFNLHGDLSILYRNKPIHEELVISELRKTKTDIEVFGTEYLPNHNATTFILLLEENEPLNNQTCFIDIYYPNKTLFVDAGNMTFLENGLYYHDFITPTFDGVYMVNVFCTVESAIPATVEINVSGFWRFEEGSGTNASDSSGNENHGVISGAVYKGSKLTNGTGLKSLFFDGVNDGIIVTDAPALDLPSISSYCSWFNTTKIGKAHIFEKTLAYNAEIDTGITKCTYGGVSVSGAISWNDGKWHHICCVQNSSKMALWVDGVLRNTKNFNSIPSNSNNLFLGYDGASNYFSGKLDEMVLFNFSLTKQQVLGIFNNGINVSSTPTIIVDELFYDNVRGGGEAHVSDSAQPVRESLSAHNQSIHEKIEFEHNETNTILLNHNITVNLKLDNLTTQAVNQTSTLQQVLGVVNNIWTKLLEILGIIQTSQGILNETREQIVNVSVQINQTNQSIITTINELNNPRIMVIS